MSEETKNTKVALSRTFEQKMAEKIKEGIGELLTDDDLKAVIEKGVHNALFEPRPKGSSRYGGIEYDPPLMSIWTESFMKEMMREAVEEWLKENQDKFAKIAKDVLQKGAEKAIMRAFVNVVQQPMHEMEGRIMDRMRNQGY